MTRRNHPPPTPRAGTPALEVHIPTQHTGADLAYQVVGDLTRWRRHDGGWSEWIEVPKPAWWQRILGWRRR